MESRLVLEPAAFNDNVNSVATRFSDGAESTNLVFPFNLHVTAAHIIASAHPAVANASNKEQASSPEASEVRERSHETA